MGLSVNIDEYFARTDTTFKPGGKLKEAVTCAVNQKENPLKPMG